MAVIFHEPCNDLTRWTSVETDGTISSSGGVFVMSAKSLDSTSTLGAYTTVPFGPLISGWTLYAQIRTTGAINIIGGLGISPVGDLAGFGDSYNHFRTGSNRDRLVGHFSLSSGGEWTSNSTSNDTAMFNVWVDVQIRYVASDGQVRLFYRNTPPGTQGSFNVNASSWTEILNGTNLYSIDANVINDDVYIYLMKFSAAQTIEVDEIYLTDNGIIGGSDLSGSVRPRRRYN